MIDASASLSMLGLATESVACMSNLRLQLRNYRLTTAEILYHLPDHPGVLQSFIWQHLDLAPHFPELRRFLDFWVREIDGKLHSVKVANTGVITPGELTHTRASFSLH
jgi:uncharacterized protein Usg